VGTYATHATDILNKYDFHEWIKLCLFFGVRDPYSIIAHTSTWFNNEEIYNALNGLTIDQFMEYISDKYDVVFVKEEPRYRMREK
jgi:hypothetical protein